MYLAESLKEKNTTSQAISTECWKKIQIAFALSFFGIDPRTCVTQSVAFLCVLGTLVCLFSLYVNPLLHFPLH